MSLIILGAGGFAPSVFDIAMRCAAEGQVHLRPVGFLDDDQSKKDRVERLGPRLIGSISEPPANLQATHYAIAVASPAARKEISNIAERLGLKPAVLIHPNATFCPRVEIGPGAIVCAGTHFDSFVKIGTHAIINKNSIIGHDSNVGSFVTISPMSVIGGGSTIGDGVMIGMTSTVNPLTKIGRGSYVASGSAVITDVAAATLVAGVPATTKKAIPLWTN